MAKKKPVKAEPVLSDAEREAAEQAKAARMERTRLAASEAESGARAAFKEGKLTLKSVLEDMMVAYSTAAPTGVFESMSIRRWRKLYRDKPDKFLEIMEKHEAKADAKKRSVREKVAELERLRESESKLRGELTAAREKWESDLRVLKDRIEELEALVPGDVVDEYENPALERLEALKERLIREAVTGG